MYCITLYFSFFSISLRFSHFKILKCFISSCTDCCFLLFHQRSFTTFFLLWFGLRSAFLYIKMAHALVNLFALIIFSDLIYFSIAFTFFDQSFTKFLSTFLNSFTSSTRLCLVISIKSLIIVFFSALVTSKFSLHSQRSK